MWLRRNTHLRGQRRIVDYHSLLDNVYMRPIGVLFVNGQKIRADLLPPFLLGHVIILQEVFDNSIRRHLIAELRLSYPFSSRSCALT